MLLLLVEKGRLGDTYPKSFRSLDLRARNRSGAPYVAPMVQELGRLCGYYDACADCVDADKPHACECDHKQRPWALLSPKLLRAVQGQEVQERQDKTLGLLLDNARTRVAEDGTASWPRHTSVSGLATSQVLTFYCALDTGCSH